MTGRIPLLFANYDVVNSNCQYCYLRIKANRSTKCEMLN